MMDLDHTPSIQFFFKLPSSKKPLYDVICIFGKVALPSVENQEEVGRSVRVYMLLLQQQEEASNGETYEG